MQVQRHAARVRRPDAPPSKVRPSSAQGHRMQLGDAVTHLDRLAGPVAVELQHVDCVPIIDIELNI